MKRAAVQVLAQIRLNLSSVDQFLAIACGLGDDNPDVKEEIYFASNEVRSSALLIDHLRNLFNHQQSIEAQRDFFEEISSARSGTNFGQKFQSSNLKQNNASYRVQHQQQQQQQQQRQDLDIEQVEKDLLNSLKQPQQQQQHHHRHRHRHPQPQPQERRDNTSSLLFTYTNQLTLVRAAKCLVANVAKILYLTDSILARSSNSLERDSCFAEEEQQQLFGATLEQKQQEEQQQQVQKYFSTTRNEQLTKTKDHHQQNQQQQHSRFAISDRLDNVANYSQLLRSFSELSGELVDLGRCIMLSQRPQTFYQNTSFPWHNNFLMTGQSDVGGRKEKEGEREGEGEDEPEEFDGGEEEAKGSELSAGYQPGELSFCLPPQSPCRPPLSTEQQNALSDSSRHFRNTRVASDKFSNDNTSSANNSYNNNNAQVAPSANEVRHHLFQAHLTYQTPLTSSTYRRPISQVPPHYRSLSTIEKLQLFEGDNFERQPEDIARSQVNQQDARIQLNSLFAGQEIIGQTSGSKQAGTMGQTASIVSDGVTLEEEEEAERDIEENFTGDSVSQDQRQRRHHKLFPCSPNDFLRGYLLHEPPLPPPPPPSTQTDWANQKPSGSIIMPPIDGGPQLEVRIQDMQTLFQVNRLIIDRSILLLLSASKCCLWQGNESLRGFSARRSILVQIRASISIIMALVKYSVFSSSSSSSSDAAKSMYERDEQLMCWPNDGTGTMKTESNSPSNPLLDSTIQGFNQATATLSALNNSQKLSNGVGNNRPKMNYIQSSNFGASTAAMTTSRDNQFDYHYLARQSPYCRSTSKLAAKTTAPISLSNGCNVPSEHHREHCEFDANAIPLSSRQQQQQQQLKHQQQQVGDSGCGVANKLFEASKEKSGVSPAAGSYLNGMSCINSNIIGIGMRSSSCSYDFTLNGIGNNNENKFNAPTRVDSQLQIMNYFLQTWNGTQSAHDAINKLQTLVVPFTRIASQTCLIEALDSIFMSQNQSNQFSSKLQQPSSTRFRALSAGVEDSCSCWRWNNNFNIINENNKENGFYDFQAAAAGGSNSDILTSRDILLINKRQLINSLNSTFLGETKTNLVERAHEFTDCPYTKHEHRETIVLLLHCIKILLNRFVKLLYKLRRKTTFISDTNLNQLRQLASQLDDTCAELKYELQSVVIEQSDELDRCNVELDLIKQIKHHCLAGDFGKVGRISGQFQEQSERLVEICKMLNQIAPTHKMKITTKALAIWFELNLGQLLNIVHCLAQNPRSKVAKDCTWAYIQVWCSFYDDFCQLARQMAYLAHSQYDAGRNERVASLYHQVLLRRQLTEHQANVISQHCHEPVVSNGSNEHQFCGQMCDESSQVNMADISPLAGNRESSCADVGNHHHHHHHQQQQQHQVGSIEHQQQRQHQKVEDQIFFGNSHSQAQTRSSLSQSQSRANEMDVMLDNALPSNVLLSTNRLVQEQQQQQHRHRVSALDQFINHANSVQSLNMLDTFGDTSGSPRSLDHYYGFGNNYHSHNRSSRATAPRPPSDTGDLQNFELRQDVCLEPSGIEYHRRRQLRQQQEQQIQNHHHQQQLRQRDLSYECNMQRESVAREQGAFYERQLPAYRDQWMPVREEVSIQPPAAPARRDIQTIEESPQLVDQKLERKQQQHLQFSNPSVVECRSRAKSRDIPGVLHRAPVLKAVSSNPLPLPAAAAVTTATNIPTKQPIVDPDSEDQDQLTGKDTDQQSSATEPDKWSDPDADAIVRGAKEIAQMALSMYQFTKGEGELNTTQDLFTQAELFAEEANELYKEVRCFSYKVPAGDLKKELLAELGTIPALVQQMQFIVKNPTVGKPATFAKVDSVIRETRSLMEAVNRVVTATLSCRQHYNMAIASMRKRTRTLSPSFRNDKGFEFESNHSSNRQSGGIGGRHGAGAGSMGSEPDIFQYGRGPSRRAVARSNTASSKTRVSFLLF